MRVFKHTYTKPLPPDAKIVERRNAKYARFTNKRGRQKEARLTKDANRILVEGSCWCIDFKDNAGICRKLKGFTDREATQRVADTLQRLLDSKGSGAPISEELSSAIERLPDKMRRHLRAWKLLEAEQAEIGRPLSELVDKYEQTLRAKERSNVHVGETVRMVKEVFDACGFHFWRDIKDQSVEEYLKDLRDGHVLCKVKGKEGKPRRVGYRRSNALLTACMSFCNWVVDGRKWARESPLRGMKKLNTKEDPRHTRRALDVEQLRTLLQKTAEGPQRYGMSGRERYLLYRLAAETGLRAGELRRLRKADFNFNAATVTVQAVRATKSKRTREQALSPSLCAELRDFLASKLPEVKAFGGSYAALTRRTAGMLQEDLAEAKIAYKDDQGDVFDFHSLRVECASLLIDSGVDPKQAQEIMRHSTIGLTMDIYTKVLGRKKKAQAIANLPDLSLPQSRRQSMPKTGTDNGPVDRDLPDKEADAKG